MLIFLLKKNKIFFNMKFYIFIIIILLIFLIISIIDFFWIRINLDNKYKYIIFTASKREIVNSFKRRKIIEDRGWFIFIGREKFFIEIEDFDLFVFINKNLNKIINLVLKIVDKYFIGF
jgi:hypothetical protein